MIAFFMLTSKYERTDGPDVAFNCPECFAKGSSAGTREVVEKNTFFWIIPFFSVSHTKITCRDCGKNFRLYKPLKEVLNFTPEKIAQEIKKRVPFLIKFCIVSSIVLFFVPLIGLIFGTIGIVGTARKTYGWYKAAVVGFILSAMMLVFMILTVMLE